MSMGGLELVSQGLELVGYPIGKLIVLQEPDELEYPCVEARGFVPAAPHQELTSGPLGERDAQSIARLPATFFGVAFSPL